MANNTSKSGKRDVGTPPVIRWRCPNCGQTLFTAPDFEPPDMCNYCNDMTTWIRVEDHESTEST